MKGTDFRLQYELLKFLLTTTLNSFRTNIKIYQESKQQRNDVITIKYVGKEHCLNRKVLVTLEIFVNIELFPEAVSQSFISSLPN